MKKVVILAVTTSFFYILFFAQTPTNTDVSSEKQETIVLTKEDFLEKVVNYEKNPKEWIYLGDKPCIVDFYATWCGPCKRYAPSLEELAVKYKEKIYIYKVDIDKEKELAEAFGIQSVPTLFIIPLKGKPTLAQGVVTKENLIRIIDEQLIKKKKKTKPIRSKY